VQWSPFAKVFQPGITCVLCGARDETQARENAAAGDIRLSVEEIEIVGRTLEG
jgi:methylglyoxal reductase